MKKLIISTFLLSILTMCQNQKEINSNELKTKQMSEKIAIEKLLFSYRDALNASNVEKVISIYTEDGVFMPSNAPSAIGLAQVKSSYEFVFKNIQLNIEFFIDEIIIHDTYAFARTTSKGTTLIHSNGQIVPEENRELFVLQKVSDQWKISRYMFNKIK